ncbi:MAG: AAA family ATPase [Oscillatoria sp. SIO1A7]|nr:AAA family ATPase [Oscillatoria sp. SIO1A7]
MRINKISVTNLFGIFNHEIPLKMGDRITMIHAPNGFGKTILLRMINGLFNYEYLELHEIPFTELRLDFDNGSYLQVKKNRNDSTSEEENNKDLSLYFCVTESKKQYESLNYKKSKQLDDLNNFIKKSRPKITRKGFNTWLDLKNNQEIEAESFINQFAQFFQNQFDQLPKISEWFSELTENTNIGFIEAQRLLRHSVQEPPFPAPRPLLQRKGTRRNSSMIASVETYAEELAEIIQDKLAEYAALSQSLDRTFPARLVQKTKSELTEETLRNKLSEIENQRFELIEAGLLGKDDNTDFQVGGEIDEPTKRILSVYIEDVEKKLSVFEDIAKKIQLLQRIIKDRFQYKKMAVSRDKGFTFTTHDGNPLAPADLSSGEQHELVMLYELLFKVEPNSLILIDEPELSLHVAWQDKFLKDLQEITKLGNFDVLLATHSPDIISDRWDLTVELKGPIA